ncbi:MAG: long-chain fatty acid--CoA ligase, partial [Steroidobacteraceae bacterium]
MPSKPRSLWESISAAGVPLGRLFGAPATVNLADLAHGSSLGGRLEELRGRSVLLVVKDPLRAALAMLELDGVAGRMVLCPADLASEHLPAIAHGAAVGAHLGDPDSPAAKLEGVRTSIGVEPWLTASNVTRAHSHATEWILLTSGTTGVPKLVQHDLATLTDALSAAPPGAERVVWATFYDIRRYGGLQIFLRGVHLGSLVPAAPGEAVP